MNAEMTAVVMAGGMGIRMSTSVPDVPKPMVDVGGMSLVEIMIRQIRDAGIEDVRLALRHRADEIREALDELPDLAPVSLTYMVEDEPLGTIGALHGLAELERTILVTNGDLLSGVDLASMIEGHRERNADLTIATHDESHRLTLGEVLSDSEGNVFGYDEKPIKVYRISSGIYLAEPSVLLLLEDREWLGFPDLATRAISSGLRVCEHFHDEPWIDVNDARDLERAREMFREDPTAFGAPADRGER